MGRSALWLLSAALLHACTGGQSGTETPAPDGGPLQFDGGVDILRAGSCACALADRSALLRATLLEIDACRVRARVDEVLAQAPELELDLDVGAELDVARVTGCGEGLAVEPNDAVLLVYAPAQGDGIEASALVATWGSEHVFGMDGDDTIALPEGERDRLLEMGACSDWFDPNAEEGAMIEAAEAVPVCD